MTEDNVIYPKQMKCVAARDLYEYGLIAGKIYTVVEEVVGFFEDRPCCIFINDSGKKVACHLSRFEDIKEQDKRKE